MDGGMVVVGKVEQFLPHFYNLKKWEQGDEPIFEVVSSGGGLVELAAWIGWNGSEAEQQLVNVQTYRKQDRSFIYLQKLVKLL